MMPLPVRALIGVLLAFIGAATAGAQSGPLRPLPQVQGQRVAAVRIISESGEVLEQNPADLPLQPGQPFTLDTERESLRQLFRTGRYADLVAQVTQVENGLRLDFLVRRNFYINEVRVLDLPEPPGEGVAISALQFGFGEIFRESDMPAALARLRQTLREAGLYQAAVTYQLSPHAGTRQMDILVHVEPGARARVGAVALTNETPFPEEELRDRLKFKTGTEITSERLTTGAENVRQWLADRSYLGAQVSLERGAYDPETNTVPLEVRLSAGFQVQVRIEGASISSGTLRRLLPIFQEGAVDEELLQEGRRNLRDYFQSDGFFNTEVDYSTSRRPATEGDAAQGSSRPQAVSEIITYTVLRGARYRLVGVAFAGNRYFNDELLRSRLDIQPAAFVSPGRFSSALLGRDAASVRGLYQANGFLQVSVTEEVIENYQGERENLFVRFEIEEGLQTRVAELRMEGNHAFSDDTLLGVIDSTPGQPFSDFNIAGDRANILALYFDQGFPEASFRATSEEVDSAAGEGPRVRLHYQIEEGRQLRVERVLVSGFEHTRPSVIRREVQLQEGQPLSEGAVVESQRRLYDLGIFTRVSIAPQNPRGTDPNKAVGVLVEEARRYTIGYGGGLEAQRLGGAGSGPVGGAFRVSPRAIFEVSKLNFTGRADSLSFKVRAGTVQRRALLTYTSSNYFGWPNLSMQLSGFYDQSRDVLTFTSQRTEGSVQLTDRLSPTSSLLFRYAYRRVVASDLRVNLEAIPLFSQPTRVSLFGVGWLRDRRDSASDATRGNFNNMNVDLASRRIGSSVSFLRAFGQNATYHQLGRRLVFVRSTRVGIQTPIGQTLSTDIPLPERFFAGGGSSLRGFGLNQAGPRDPVTGFPIGGFGMLMFNQQLQFPMRLPFVGDRVGGAVFYDAGNVFGRFRGITLRLAPPAPVFDPTSPNECKSNCTNEMNYFSHTVGFELRYRTPIGPVSIDLGYQLNPASFLVPDGTTLPNGDPGLRVTRLPAFQLFVNLGPTF